MKKEIQIAILAILTIGASIWGFKFISGTSLFSGDKLFYTFFNNVKDVNTATPVLINGYQVGTVISIEPEPNDVNNIKIGFQVSKDIRLPDYTIVELRSSSPLGGKELELVFDKMCSDDNCAESGDVLEGKAIGLIRSLINTDELEPHVDSLTSSITKSIKALGDPESDSPLSKAIIQLALTFENLAHATEKLDNLMAKSSKNIESTFENMSKLSGDLIKSNAKLDSVLANVDLISKDLSKASLSKTLDKSNKAFDQATSSLASLESALKNANVTINELNELVRSFNTNEGSLGKLMNDSELYDNIEESSYNMNLLLQDIRLNPRRYFKLFGKKSDDYTLPEDDPAMPMENNKDSLENNNDN